MRRVSVLLASVAVLVACSAGCNKEPPAGASAGPETSGARTSARTVESAPAPAASSLPSSDGVYAEIGRPAPNFLLKDLDGNEVRLSSFKGKTVVLEWWNPGCPFVDKSHTKGSLKDAAKKHAKNGVVWLAVNSNAAGKQGHGVEANRAGAKKYGMDHPILLDELGGVGKAYRATNTPHMFVVDGTGTLVYMGAVDNSPDGEGESPTGGKLVSYVDEAVAAVAAGKTPATTETKAYGCSVKYAQ
ncbi:MAG: redoxin family protein [Labilithrix sp.]|nr:redoxin family protein [Labilithrix sp.]